MEEQCMYTFSRVCMTKEPTATQLSMWELEPGASSGNAVSLGNELYG